VLNKKINAVNKINNELNNVCYELKLNRKD